MDSLGKLIGIIHSVIKQEDGMSTVITATGKAFESDYFVAMVDPPVLFVRILNQTEDVVRAVFSDKAETSCLTCGGRVAFGYTNLQTIFKEGDAFKVMLTK